MRRLRSLSGNETVAYGVTRIANGLLALAATAIPVALVGAGVSGQYFTLWTAAWICSVAARFGSDAVLPRLIAESEGGAGLEIVGRRLAVGAACAIALTVPACLVLDAPTSALAISLVAATAVLWGRLFVVAGVMRAQLHVLASGVVTNVVWALANVLGPLAAGVAIREATPTDLLLGTFVASVAALTVAELALRRRRAAPEPALRARRLARRTTDETIAAAALATLVEVGQWSPMLLAGLVHLEPAETAGVFAATRIAGVASWGYQAVVATAGPRIARAIVARDADGVRALVHRAARQGTLVTAPLVLLGILLAPVAVEIVLGEPSADATTALRILLVPRLVDAATGPVGEAFVVGRRVRLDATTVAAGLLLAVAAAAVVPATVAAVAILAAAASITTNLLRVALFAPSLIGPLARAAVP